VTDDQDRVITVFSTGRFGDGRYERFLVHGPKALRLRVTKQRSPCATLSGVFLDGAPPLQPLPPGTPDRAKPGPGQQGIEDPTASDALESRVKVLRARYAQLVENSRQSILSLVCSEELSRFEADALRAAGEQPSAEVLWWVSECKRLRFNYGRSYSLLGRYLETARANLPEEKRYEFFRLLAEDFVAKRLGAQHVLSAMQYAAAEKESEEEEFARLLRAAGLGYLDHAAKVWLAEQPLTRPRPAAQAQR